MPAAPKGPFLPGDPQDLTRHAAREKIHLQGLPRRDALARFKKASECGEFEPDG